MSPRSLKSKKAGAWTSTTSALIVGKTWFIETSTRSASTFVDVSADSPRRESGFEVAGQKPARLLQRLRCENYFQARKLFECVSLCRYFEQRSDKLRLPLRITSG